MHVSRWYFHFEGSALAKAPCVTRTLTANIRRRRGSKVAINLPIFFDEHTPRPFVDPTIPWERNIYPEDSGTSSVSHVHVLNSPIALR